MRITTAAAIFYCFYKENASKNGERERRDESLSALLQTNEDWLLIEPQQQLKGMKKMKSGDKKMNKRKMKRGMKRDATRDLNLSTSYGNYTTACAADKNEKRKKWKRATATNLRVWTEKKRRETLKLIVFLFHCFHCLQPGNKAAAKARKKYPGRSRQLEWVIVQYILMLLLTTHFSLSSFLDRQKIIN